MEDEQQQHHQLANYGGGGGGGGGSSNTAGDLRHLFSPRPMFPAAALYPPPPLPPPHNHSLLSAATGGAFTPLHYPNPSYESMMLVMGSGRGSHVPDHVLQSGVVVDFNSDSTTTTTSTTAPALAVTTMPINLGFDGDCGGGQTARWPRQETLTLLEVRSRLDHKFKEANHKGPLWDEVSRIMCDEHGYRRSGKKCREKFENLYKYYKKTKGGKAGRQDGKNYRFFRQLDALYGDTSSVNTAASIPYQFHTTMNTPPTNISLYDHHQDAKVHSISLTNSSSELQTSSSEDKVKKRGKHSWKSKIKGFIDLQMRKIMERQDSWLEKMEMTLEHKEKERMLRDEEWRSQESKRMEREHRLWVEERAWMEARDRAMINALEKITGKELLVEEKDLSSSHHSEELHQSRVLRERENEEGDDQDGWEESEIAELIRLRSSMDARFEYYSGSELDQISLWEEIASRMASLGYDRRSATLYKEKWDLINSLLMKNKKMRENWKNESVGCSTSSGQQTGQSNLVYSYGEINGTRSVGPVLPDIGLGEGGGGEGVGGNSMTDSFKFLLGND